MFYQITRESRQIIIAIKAHGPLLIGAPLSATTTNMAETLRKSHSYLP